MMSALRLRLGTGTAVPVPRRFTTKLGFAASLLPIAKLPVKICVDAGENLTIRSKLPAGATVIGTAGLSTIENGAAGSLMDEITRLAPPVFDIVTARVRVVRTVPNSSGFGAALIIATGGGGGFGVVTPAIFEGGELPKLLNDNTR